MDDKKIYKIVHEEITKALINESQTSDGLIGNLISKFYMFIIKNDLKAARKHLEENPGLIRIAKRIKQQSDEVAKLALQDKEFLKFLFDLKDKE